MQGHLGGFINYTWYEDELIIRWFLYLYLNFCNDHLSQHLGKMDEFSENFQGGVIFNPKIYVADFRPLYTFFRTFSKKNCNKGGSKTVWIFSENSFVLLSLPVPKENNCLLTRTFLCKFKFRSENKAKKMKVLGAFLNHNRQKKGLRQKIGTSKISTFHSSDTMLKFFAQQFN